MAVNVVVNTTAGSDTLSFSANILTHITGVNYFTDKIVILGTPAVAGDTPDRFVITGSFTYDASMGDPSADSLTGATITGAKITQGPGIAAYTTISGASVTLDSATVQALINGGDPNPFFALFGSVNFVGNSGNDVGYGGLANDTLTGGGGNDTLKGLDGNDLIQGGTGADNMVGGKGVDTLSYQNSAAGVTVSLAGAASGGDAAGDTFTGFENITGSAAGDHLIGNAGINILKGMLGNDFLRGNGGADTLDGSGGTDTADYAGSTAGVTVSLVTNTGTGGFAQGDKLISIENLNGSSNDDTLTGNSSTNRLVGSGGNDTLDGGAGNDVLDGGTGNDRLISGAGADTLFGRAGADHFVLSAFSSGVDTIKDFVSGTDAIDIASASIGGKLAAGADLTGLVEVNAGGVANAPETRFILDSSDGKLYFDGNGSASGGTVILIATLQGVTTITSGDLHII